MFNGRSATEEASLVRENMTHMDHEGAVWGSRCMCVCVCLSASCLAVHLYLCTYVWQAAATSHAC